MKIFLTGGSGMVGKNILEHPSAKKYEIISPNRNQLNLLNRLEVKNFLIKEKPDLIIHAAGKVGGIQSNIENSISFLSENVEIGLNVILMANLLEIPNLLNLASSCMYPKNATNPLKETMILEGKLEPTNEGYALSKILSTKICEYISENDKNKNYKTIIPCNLYGRHDNFNLHNSHLISAIIRKIHEAKKNKKNVVDIWGDGNARREFMNVRDLADFIFFALTKIEKLPQNINIGIGHDYSIKDYYYAVAKVLNYDGKFQYDLSKPVGMHQKLVDISLLKDFGWSHKISLTSGIEETFKFFIEDIESGI